LPLALTLSNVRWRGAVASPAYSTAILDAKLEAELADLDAADAAELVASTCRDESAMNFVAPSVSGKVRMTRLGLPARETLVLSRQVFPPEGVLVGPGSLRSCPFVPKLDALGMLANCS
jgi:hypothetical protein